MSKNILFRGQTRKKGEKVTMSGTPIPSNWVFGGIFPQNNGGDFAIIYQQAPEIQKFPVYAETVCQYTGKNDKYGGKIFENDIITYVATVNGVDTPCKGKVFYSDFLATYLVFVYTDLAHSFAQNNKLDPNPGSIPLSSCAHIIVIGNVFDGEYELPEKVKNTPFETFLSIAYELDRLAFDIDPYEYQDNEGTESIQTVAENLLHDAYRASVVAMLKEQHRYFSIESAMGQDYANAAERSHSILKRLADIFGDE